MDTREIIKSYLREGGRELDLVLEMAEGGLRAAPEFGPAFRKALRLIVASHPSSPLQGFAAALESWVLSLEADAFADGGATGFPSLGADSGLEEIQPLPQFLKPIRRRLPCFVKTQAGKFINMRNMESLWPSGLLYLQQEAVQLNPEELATLAALLDERAIPLGRIEVTAPAEKGGE